MLLFYSNFPSNMKYVMNDASLMCKFQHTFLKKKAKKWEKENFLDRKKPHDFIRDKHMFVDHM